MTSRLNLRRVAGPALLASLLCAASDPRAMTLPDESEAWIRVDTAHLSLFSNASEEATLRIGRNIEVFRAVLSRIGPALSADSPLPTSVFVFRDDRSFRPYKPRQKGRREGAPANIAGYFVKHQDGNYVGVDATPASDPWSIIYHEYFHFFLYNNFTDIPLWFSEGIAECYGTFRAEGSAAEIGGPIRAHVSWLKTHPMIPPRRLFAVDFDSPEYHEESRQGTFYAQSWALVEYLLWGPASQGGSGVRFLRDLPRGSSLSSAIAPIVGKDETALLDRLSAYVKKGGFAFSRIAIDDLRLDDRARVAPLSRQEALYRLGDFLLHADPERLDDAEQHFQASIRIDASYGPAHAGLGQVLDERRRYAEARSAFEKAIDLDPSNQLIALKYAYALISEAFPPGVSRLPVGADSPPALLRARDLFQRTTRKSPDIAEAWAGLGATYAYEDGDLGPGIEALETARRLLPARADIALNLASLYARSGQRSRAQDLVDRVVSRSDEPTTRAAGREVLFRADLAAAESLLAKGKLEAGLAGLRTLVESAPTPQLKSEARERLQAMESHASRQREVDLYNEAASKARAQEVDEAVRRLESLLEVARDPEVREQSARLLSDLRQVRAYNEAVERYRRRDFKGAAALLHRILDESKDDRLVQAAKDLLVKVRAASPGVR